MFVIQEMMVLLFVRPPDVAPGDVAPGDAGGKGPSSVQNKPGCQILTEDVLSQELGRRSLTGDVLFQEFLK